MAINTFSQLALVYLLLLVPICLLAWHKNRAREAQEYYLAGRSLGPFVLVLTLFATTYSSSSMMGYPGEAWQRGFGWIISLGIPMGAMLSYHLVLPRLRPLATELGFISPGDWLRYRFADHKGSSFLRVTLSLAMVLVSCNILFAQFKAMGEITEALSGGTISYAQGVLIMALIVLVYDMTGGMRAVAWTDALQACLMIFGLSLLVIWILGHFENLEQFTDIVASNRPESLAPPDLSFCIKWLSLMLLAGLSITVYPHALQRYFAARSHQTAYRAMAGYGFLMVPMHMAVIIIGLGALHILSGSHLPQDQILPLLLDKLNQSGGWLSLGAGMIFIALCAAMMSTADSVLLSTVSMLRRDFLRQPASKSMGIDSFLAIAVVALLAGAAMYRDITLWRLVEMKLEVLLQCFPAFVLCLHNRRIPAWSVLAGLIFGLLIYAYGLNAGLKHWHNVHLGLWALLVNILVCLAGVYFQGKPTQELTKHDT